MEDKTTAEFQLDTTGWVDHVPGHPHSEVTWNDLSPFVQGYVEAALVSAGLFYDGNTGDHCYWSFEQLASVALAQIMADCELRLRHAPIASDPHFGLRYDPHQARKNGQRFWKERQNGERKNFPPLTPYLGDDGLVYLRETAR